MTPTQTYSRCGCTAESLTEFEGRMFCPDCLEDLTTVCVDCGGRTGNAYLNEISLSRRF